MILAVATLVLIGTINVNLRKFEYYKDKTESVIKLYSMAWYDKMSEEDRKKFQELGFIKKPHGAPPPVESKDPPKSWSLLFSVGGTVMETVIDEKDYGLCRWKKKEIKDDPQYKGGSLDINPNY